MRDLHCLGPHLLLLAACPFVAASCQHRDVEAPGEAAPPPVLSSSSSTPPQPAVDRAASLPTKTKIKHLVVLFGENISFDHYFGTYPSSGSTAVNGLATPLDAAHGFAPLTGVDLLHANPNSRAKENGSGAVNPFLLGPEQAYTRDQVHKYKSEQLAAHGGAMDLFPANTGIMGPAPGTPAEASTKGLVMGYFDGSTVSALWSYARRNALNDNAWTATFGPSTPGAINLISGQTNGIEATTTSPDLIYALTPDGNGDYTLIDDPDPIGDECSDASRPQLSLRGSNVGDLLNEANVSWGWFQGGFDLGITNPNGTTRCLRSRVPTAAGATQPMLDYVPHHQPFQYYASTINARHDRPSSVAAIGNTYQADGKTLDPARHQYDEHDFFDALERGNMPAVSYLKAPAVEDGHAGYSNPVDEQKFIEKVVTAVQAHPELWATTAIVLTYDDSDGWYDHQAPPIVNPSNGPLDGLNGPRACRQGLQQGGPARATPLLGRPPRDGGAAKPALGRCGYGTRVPLLVVSPFARPGYVDHTLVDTTSVLRFVEDNWLGGKRIQEGGSFDTIAGSLEGMFAF